MVLTTQKFLVCSVLKFLHLLTFFHSTKIGLFLSLLRYLNLHYFMKRLLKLHSREYNKINNVNQIQFIFFFYVDLALYTKTKLYNFYLHAVLSGSTKCITDLQNKAFKIIIYNRPITTKTKVEKKIPYSSK